jgi:hypothetical protein
MDAKDTVLQEQAGHVKDIGVDFQLFAPRAHSPSRATGKLRASRPNPALAAQLQGLNPRSGFKP